MCKLKVALQVPEPSTSQEIVGACDLHHSVAQHSPQTRPPELESQT